MARGTGGEKGSGREGEMERQRERERLERKGKGERGVWKGRRPGERERERCLRGRGKRKEEYGSEGKWKGVWEKGKPHTVGW